MINVRHRDAGTDRAADFLASGLPARHFFPHRVYAVPRGGPDGIKYAERMCGVDDPAQLGQLLLFGLPDATAGLPEDLFFDDEIVWHQQQLGLPGQVAHANLVLTGDDLRVTVFQSDLVQRISRRRPLKTVVEKRFKGWAHLMLNAVLDHALDLGVRTVHWPTSAFVMRQGDASRQLQPELFERVYDATPRVCYDPASSSDWWRLDVRDVVERVVRLDRHVSPLPAGKTICVVHDIERGLGHLRSEPAFVAEAERVSPGALDRMLAAEAAACVRATYGVVGRLLDEVRDPIEAAGHTLAFHSFEHDERMEPARDMRRCRGVDYRLKGYRPLQPGIPAELEDRTLVRNNFEWVAASSVVLGTDRARTENRVVKIPIHLDDVALHTGEMDYDRWEKRLLGLVDRLDLVVVGLHDCYGAAWLDRYDRLLERLATGGELLTCDDVAAREILAAAT